jgi:hypothetical protein
MTDSFGQKIFKTLKPEKNENKGVQIMEREEKIRSIAYSIWEKEGYPDGRQMEHWLKAETICDAEGREENGGKSVKAPEQKRRRSSRPAQRRISH